MKTNLKTFPWAGDPEDRDQWVLNFEAELLEKLCKMCPMYGCRFECCDPECMVKEILGE